MMMWPTRNYRVYALHLMPAKRNDLRLKNRRQGLISRLNCNAANHRFPVERVRTMNLQNWAGC